MYDLKGIAKFCIWMIILYCLVVPIPFWMIDITIGFFGGSFKFWYICYWLSILLLILGVTGILRALISILVGEYREFIRNFRSVFVNKSDTYAAKRSNYSNSSSDNNIPYAEWWVVDETIPTEKEMFLTEETILYEEMKNSVW